MSAEKTKSTFFLHLFQRGMFFSLTAEQCEKPSSFCLWVSALCTDPEHVIISCCVLLLYFGFSQHKQVVHIFEIIQLMLPFKTHFTKHVEVLYTIYRLRDLVLYWYKLSLGPRFRLLNVYLILLFILKPHILVKVVGYASICPIIL